MKTSIHILATVLVLGAGAATFAGCAGTPTRKSTGEVIDDATITAKVKTALLRDTVVKAFDVGVDTFRATVQLNGFVDTAEQKARAEEIARNVSGVGTVQNRLTVRTEAVPPPRNAAP